MSNSENTWLDREFISAFTLNDQGVGELNITETATTGDPIVTITGKYTSQTTADASVVELALPWAVGPADLWALEAYVTAKSVDAAVRRCIKVSALVWGDGSTATLDATPTPVVSGTGNATATITVTGSTMRVELSPIDATPLVWGLEVRAQKI